MQIDAAVLRRYAIGRSLKRAPDLISAVRQLGYVQADPIRAPARAQDLILFQRLDDYRIDDLEREYAALPITEDTIYNYGFFPAEHARLLHPCELGPRRKAFVKKHLALHKKLLALLHRVEDLHPRDAERELAAGRHTNGWGGSSSTTTMLLEILHRQGHARVTRRDAGIRVYARHIVDGTPIGGIERAAGLIRTLVNLYAPIPRSSLMTFLRAIESSRKGVECVTEFARAVKRGEYRCEKIDDIEYVWPAEESLVNAPTDEVRDDVRLLAPFDPVVWDRKRFTHFWGWDYRFEAYTPAKKRIRGYYALPMLWRDDMIGWANVNVEGNNVHVVPGLAKQVQLTDKFHNALDREATRFAKFLKAR